MNTIFKNPLINKKKIGKIVLAILIMILGIFMFIYGGYDDSPGAQGLGLLMFIFGIVIILRGRKRNIS